MKPQLRIFFSGEITARVLRPPPTFFYRLVITNEKSPKPNANVVGHLGIRNISVLELDLKLPTTVLLSLESTLLMV